MMSRVNGEQVLKGKKGVFFDMDGVLYDSMGYHAASWRDAFHHFGIDFPIELCYYNEGRTAASTINLIYQKDKKRDASEKEIKELYAKKTELIAAFPAPLPFEGALILMSKLKRDGVEIWVVTGSSQEEFLRRLLNDFNGFITPDRIISAKDVKQGKPHPEPYLMALQQSGLKTDEVVVIENAPLGVQSAKAAGIYTIAVNTGILDDQVLVDSGADLLIQDLRELN